MADEENVEMQDLDREDIPEDDTAVEETTFDDIEPLIVQRPDPNRSIQIIDTSISRRIQESLREVGKAVGAERRSYTNERTAASVAEEQVENTDDNLVNSILHESIESLEEYVEQKYQETRRELPTDDEKYGNILREVRGVLRGGVLEQNIPREKEHVDAQLEQVENKRKHWPEVSEAQTDNRLKRFYKDVANIVEIQKGIFKLNIGLKPKSDVATKILEKAIETNNLLRFEKFKSG